MRVEVSCVEERVRVVGTVGVRTRERGPFAERRVEARSFRAFDEFDPGHVGENLHRLFEIDVFNLHNERKNVAADVANPTLERLPLRINLQTRTRIVVPRATSDKVRSLPTQRNVPLDQIDDVDRVANLLSLIERRRGQAELLGCIDWASGAVWGSGDCAAVKFAVFYVLCLKKRVDGKFLNFPLDERE